MMMERARTDGLVDSYRPHLGSKAVVERQNGGDPSALAARH